MICSRRRFFTDFVRGLVPAADDVPNVTEEKFQRHAWLRPPGARDEQEFLQTCTRCTDCIEACPYQSIRRLGPEFAELSGTPAIIADESPCYLCEDLPCIAACKPQALVSTQREQVAMGTARLDRESCYVAQGQRCDYCVTRCPLQGAAIEWGPDSLPQIHEQACTGCAVCAYLCPAHALSVTPAWK